jgi:hypothetical protein
MNDLSGADVGLAHNVKLAGGTRPCKSGRIFAQNRFSRLLKTLY